MRDLRAILPFARPYKWRIFVATICMLLVTAASLAGPWAIRGLLGSVEQGAAAGMARINTLAIVIVVIFLVRALARFGSDYISHCAAWQMVEDIRLKMYDSLQKMSLGYHSDKQTGELMSRVINDTRTFEVLLAHAIPTVVVNGLTLLGVFLFLANMNLTLALLTLVPVPFLVWLVQKFSKISRPLFRKNQEKVGELNAILQDNLSGIREIKAFTQEEHESKRTGLALASQTKAMLKALKVSNAFHPGIEFVASLGTAIVVFFGGRLALAGQLPVKDLVAYFLYLNAFYQPIMALGQINEGLQEALGSARRVLSIIEAEPEIVESPNGVKLGRAKGRVEFRNVSFQYVDKIPVLQDISFLIRPGETLALVGATGVGKSTIASLIPRFYDPDEGKILIDNTDIRDFTLKSLRQQISIVSQDVFLFNGTVLDNIVYGSPAASAEDILRAAKAANAHEFILDLEEGYSTRIGERGVKLSGGQKQRLSIARAILRDAPILILDEATSAVDTKTERLIQEALNKLKSEKTALIIAHRLSTIQDADQIILLEEGRIAERGSHQELLALGGLYYQLQLDQGAVNGAE